MKPSGLHRQSIPLKTEGGVRFLGLFAVVTGLIALVFFGILALLGVLTVIVVATSGAVPQETQLLVGIGGSLLVLYSVGRILRLGGGGG